MDPQEPEPEPDPEPRNPLSPYYPSEMPSMEGNGRRWFAILMVLVYASLLVGSFLVFLAYHLAG